MEGFGFDGARLFLSLGLLVLGVEGVEVQRFPWRFLWGSPSGIMSGSKPS